MTNSATLGSFGDASNAPLVFRNKIINGGFDIWQRGTSQTSSGYGSDDRWNNANSGSTKTASQQTFTVGQTDVPGNPRYWSRTVVTTSAGSGNNCLKYQTIENVATLSGQTATLSFWAKADASKNIAVEFYQGFGTGGSPSSAVTGIGVTTCALTTTWKYFTVTVSIPSISGKTLGTNNDHGLSVNFWFDAGSSFNARTNSLGQQSGTFDIAQVQLEQGLSATPFEQRPIGMELSLCQRYFEIIQKQGFDVACPVMLAGSTLAEWQVQFKTEKFKTPTLWTNGTGNFGRVVSYNSSLSLSVSNVTALVFGGGTSTTNTNISLTGSYAGTNPFNTFDTAGTTRDIGVEAEL